MSLMMGLTRISGDTRTEHEMSNWPVPYGGHDMRVFLDTSTGSSMRLPHAAIGCSTFAWNEVYSPLDRSSDSPSSLSSWPSSPGSQHSLFTRLPMEQPIFAYSEQCNVYPHGACFQVDPGYMQEFQHVSPSLSSSSEPRTAPSPILRGTKSKTRGKGLRKDALSSDSCPRQIIRADRNGKIQGTMITFGTDQKVRATYDATKRGQTQLTRKYGACQRCRALKWRCDRSKDQYTPCERCDGLSTFSPCIRVSILDINLFRLGSTRNDYLDKWMQRQRSGVVASEVRTVSITQDIGEQIHVRVSRFAPEVKDVLTYHWKDSENLSRELEMPPYCIYDMEQADRSMRAYVERSVPRFVDSIMDGENEIIQDNFEVARRYARIHKDSLVADALLIWAATRVTEKTWRICGQDTLDEQPCYEKGNPWNGTVPVTPIMDTQLDHLVLRSILIPTQKRVLKNLDNKIRGNKREDWLDIFLFIFISMSNFEYIFSDMITYATRHAMVGKPRGRPNLADSYTHACKSLLAHFHFTYRGAAPLHIDWTRPQAKAAANGMSREQRVYLQSVAAKSKQQNQQQQQQQQPQQQDRFGNHARPDMYTTRMYWCSQVSAENWRADTRHSERDFEFTEDDFLTS